MDTALYLRRHSTVVRDRERKGLVSVGAAFRYRKSREAAARASERKREQRRLQLSQCSRDELQRLSYTQKGIDAILSSRSSP